MDYTEARRLALSARDHRSKPIANHTRAEIIDDHTVGILLHSTYVVKLFEDGSFELNTGGWYTVTTKDRINTYIPGGWSSVVRVGSHRSKRSPARWWLFAHDWTKIAPFFDGIRVGADGTILNPQPEAVAAQAEMVDAALDKAITKYLDLYMAAAREQIYVDALDQDPEGATSCWDCSVVANDKPELEGRTTEGNNKLAHLERHVGNREIVPELAWAAMRAKGYRDAGIAYHLGSTDTSIVQTQKHRGSSDPVRSAIRSFLRSRLLSGTSGARPTAFVQKAS